MARDEKLFYTAGKKLGEIGRIIIWGSPPAESNIVHKKIILSKLEKHQVIDFAYIGKSKLSYY